MKSITGLLTRPRAIALLIPSLAGTFAAWILYSLAISADGLGGRLLMIDRTAATIGVVLALAWGVAVLAAPRRVLERTPITKLLLLQLSLFSASAVDHAVLFLIAWLGVVYCTASTTDDDGQSKSRIKLPFAYQACSYLAFLLFVSELVFLQITGTVDHGTSLQVLTTISARPVLFSLVLLSTACALGVPPFHGWVVPVLSSPRLDLFAPLAQISIAFTLLSRMVVPMSVQYHEVLLSLAPFFACATLYVALLLFGEERPKRMIAYLYLGQISLLFLALSLGLLEERRVLHEYVVNILVATSGLLVGLVALVSRAGPERVRSLSGMIAAYPDLGLCFLFFIMSLIGFPGTLGFLSEESLLTACVAKGWLLATPVVIAMALNGFSAFRLFGQLFFGATPSQEFAVMRLFPGERFALYSLSVVLAVCGVLGL